MNSTTPPSSPSARLSLSMLFSMLLLVREKTASREELESLACRPNSVSSAFDLTASLNLLAPSGLRVLMYSPRILCAALISLAMV